MMSRNRPSQRTITNAPTSIAVNLQWQKLTTHPAVRARGTGGGNVKNVDITTEKGGPPSVRLHQLSAPHPPPFHSPSSLQLSNPSPLSSVFPLSLSLLTPRTASLTCIGAVVVGQHLPTAPSALFSSLSHSLTPPTALCVCLPACLTFCSVGRPPSVAGLASTYLRLHSRPSPPCKLLAYHEPIEETAWNNCSWLGARPAAAQVPFLSAVRIARRCM